MIKTEITKEKYTVLVEYFTEYHPDVAITLIECDDNLEKLGFCISAPCIVSLDLDFEKANEILEQLTDFEIEACYDHPYPKDNFYISRYEKYGWIYDYLFYLMRSDKVKAENDNNETKAKIGF